MNFRWMDLIGNFFRGVLMGGADVIPGVSGGTVALIVGIYERLVTAISRIDSTSVQHLRKREFTQLFERVDLPLLAPLAIGIAIGVIALGGVMNSLLVSPATRSYTLAAFFGMILASAILVARIIRSKSSAETSLNCFIGAAGVTVALAISYSSPHHSGELSYGYLFVCGLLAICAMILPGISGAYILLLLGTYEHLTEILKRLPRGDVDLGDLITVAVFGCGCVVGLLSFSRLLQRLLRDHKSATMSCLVGFMIGALREIWPFQRDLTPAIEKLKHKHFEKYLPEFNTDLLVVIVIAAVAAMAVWFLVWFTHKKQQDGAA
ncbi:MAG: putative membrane protein [Pirellulaceae bacterium]|jgi:putative membrane protein